MLHDIEPRDPAMTPVQTQIDKLAARVDALEEWRESRKPVIRQGKPILVAEDFDDTPNPPGDGDHGADAYTYRTAFPHYTVEDAKRLLYEQASGDEWIGAQLTVTDFGENSRVLLLSEDGSHALEHWAYNPPEPSPAPDEVSEDVQLDLLAEYIVDQTRYGNYPDAAKVRDKAIALGLAAPADRTGVVTDAMVEAGTKAYHEAIKKGDFFGPDSKVIRPAIESALRVKRGEDDRG